MKKLATVIAVALFFVGMIAVSINTGADSQQGSVILANSATLTMGAPSTFFLCSTPVQDSQWTYSPAYSTMKCDNSTYLAYGKGGVVTSPTFTLSAHKGIVVNFKLAFIDSWDSEFFTITADGVTVYNQPYAMFAADPKVCGNPGFTDMLTDVRFGFSHTASTVVFSIFSNLNEDISNEAWGICNFTIILTPYPVQTDGTPGTLFRCSGPAQEDSWQYPSFSGFKTIKCLSQTYLAYGKGETVNSSPFYFGAHSLITVSFKVAFIDSWNNEYFKVAADGKEVYSLQWNAKNSRANTCQNSKYKDAYDEVSFSFSHTASSLVLTFSSTIKNSVDKQAWGICDFSISVLPGPYFYYY